MVASALQSSRPLYRVIGRSGAVVRADVELDSAQVGDLVYGAVVVAADASVAKTSAGVSRRRIVKPVGGYVSSRVLRPLSSDEATAAKQELLRQQSERGERGAATKDRGVITTKAPSKNAIADSIARKGGNSYYFAHGEQGRAEKTKVSVKVDTAPVKLETSARREVPITEVREFGFAEEDGGAKISVYVPAKGAAAIADDDVTLLWDDTSVVLRFWHQGHKRQLDLPGRKGPFIRTRGRMDCKVKQCKLKKKPDKLVLLVYLDLHPETDSEDDA
ncbi:hypothetical protein JL720_782 [Aureococcus anophagefferens]|nr:hypothetical protein JL720_782 [Aureococcus anophagefferens]